MQETEDPVSRQRWFQVKNVGSTTIPPFACLYPEEADSDGVVLVRQHTQDSAKLWCFNGPRPIKVGKYGSCTVSFPVYVQDDPAAPLPVNGDVWGTQANSYMIAANGRRGFIIVGGHLVLPSYHRVQILPEICAP